MVAARLLPLISLHQLPAFFDMDANTNPNKHNPWYALAGYLLAAIALMVGWQLRDQSLIAAREGLGYALGIIGSVMMVLLLLYPIRKRARLLKNVGAVRHWFRAHMILGVMGPILVLFHSNFSLGSINSRVALFCTIVVAASGILGRYLYAKIHHGLYGQRLTLASLRSDINEFRGDQSRLGSIVSIVNTRLAPLEDAVGQLSDRPGDALSIALQTSFQLMWLKYSVRRSLREQIDQMAFASSVIAADKKRLTVNTFNYLNRRLSVLRKFAQLSVCERLFSWWHVVHYPLFMVLVVAAIVHVIAVHMY